MEPDAGPVALVSEDAKLALAPPAASLLQPLSSSAVSWLARLASRLVGPIAFFGAMVIPDRNPGVASEGTLPGYPDIAYRIDHDTGTLRLAYKSDADPANATVALLGQGGLYREVETGLAVARALPNGGVVLDTATATDLAPGPREKPKVGTDDEPKLCPTPQNDRPGGRMLFDIQYEQYVRDTVNPQRNPQLDPNLTFALAGSRGPCFL